MDKNQSSKNIRRPLAFVSTIATNHIHLRNPWVTVWLSALFPGFGQIFLGSYVKGFLLIIWEIVINVESKLNLAILYSFTGQFNLIKETVNIRWLLLYAATFVYAIWDSYRSTVDLNKFAILAQRNHASVVPFKMDALEINYFDKRNPWVAVIWSVFMPGLGHLYTHRLPTGFFVLIWWIAITYFSHLMEGVHYTAIGAFEQVKISVDPQWLLFMPSIYCFSIYDAYVHTVEYNKLFEYEQAMYLNSMYQSKNFKKPI
ncbi:hypothetical protein H1S01_04495 [Heliobacterium chlorum]|uniref:Uncharacterized protein n=1 Tax=Heliobacterium chlorum TaxID=2698 RepID=A0ABR7T2K3_HELCL|nr:hypothetical protein [Heliobacterium chlorum]MBC9783771.1 hypothetical protein [Heliobacterium chlorum]